MAHPHHPPPLPQFTNSHQELSLYAYIPAARQPQLLKILAGIAGMAPEHYTQHHLIYRPARPKPSPSAADPFYIQLVSRVDLPKDQGKEEKEERGGGKAIVYEPRKQQWSMRLEDLPEVTRKPFITRSIYSATSHSGDLLQFMRCLGYTYALLTGFQEGGCVREGKRWWGGEEREGGTEGGRESERERETDSD